MLYQLSYTPVGEGAHSGARGGGQAMLAFGAAIGD